MLLLVSSLSIHAAGPTGQPKTVGTADKLLSFSGGLAAVNVGGKWGFINTDGQVAIKFMFREVGSFDSSLAPACVDKNKWGYINKKGLFVINPRFDMARPFSNGLAPVKKGNLWGIIDTKGRLVHDYAYEDLKGFYYGLAPAKRIGKWGFIDRNGRFVLKRQWLEAGEFREGLAPVKDLENQWGFIDTKGKIYIESQFDEAREFSDKLAAVKVESKWGFINYKGRYRINPEYEEVKRFSEGYAAAKKNGKWGYIDRLGHDDIPFIYDEASDFSDYIALVSKDGLAYYIDDEGGKTLDISMKTGMTPAIAAPSTVITPFIAGNILKASTLDFEVYYVSAANSMDSVEHKNDAIYLIKIKGADLNQDQLFSKGLNGFRYEIDFTGKPDKYKVYAFPINGVKYSDDGYKSAALNPYDIAFYWIGPKPDGKCQVSVTQQVRDFNKGRDDIVAGPVVKILPSIGKANADLDYTISFKTTAGETYFNGVCAYPVDIRLTKNGLDVPDEVYDRLVFYSKEQTGVLNKDKIIGADPADENHLALMPAQWGNKVHPALPRYGISNEYLENSMKYRTYYVFATPAARKERLISVQLLDDSGEISVSNDFTLTAREPAEVKTVSNIDAPNSDMVRTLYLQGSPNPYLCDPSKGDFDFVFDKVSPGNYYLLPLLPEGLNERELSARFNFSTFKSGFYMRPVYSGGKVTGFNVSDRTASLHNTWGKDIFAFIFDIYGRYDRSPLFRDNQKKIVKRNDGRSEESLYLKWINYDCANIPDAGGNRLMIGLKNETGLPVIYKPWGKTDDSKYDYKKRIYSPTEIIVSPKRESFYATGDDQIFWKNTETCWEMEGYSLLSDEKRFHNKYLGKKTAAGAAGLIKMKSEKGFKNPDAQRPLGSDGKFLFCARGTDKYATHWLVRYNDWSAVYSGFGYYGGKKRENHVAGGDFNGTMHDTYFNQNTW